MNHKHHALAAAGFAAIGALPAALAQANSSETGQLTEVQISASADASAEGLPPSYTGGQVAKGGRLGVLGNLDAIDAPFSLTSYTHALIQNQQAKGVGDVLLNDASVRTARGFGNFQETYFIRGFLLGSDDISYNGLYGILPRQYIASELFERVEVLRGASAFLSGATPGGDGIGGAINLLPKRAPNEPLSQITLGTNDEGQAYAATDIARRFGVDGSAGIRLNAAYRDGDTSVDREEVRLGVVSLALDWRSRDLRLSGDIGHQDHRLREPRPNVSHSGLSHLPDAPDSASNWAQPWTYSNAKGTFATLRGEYDISERLTGWFALGASKGKEANALSNPTITDADTGNGTSYRFDNTREDSNRSAELGLRAKVRTGAVSHALVASYAYFDHKRKNAYAMDWQNTHATNLYTPNLLAAAPAFSAGVLLGNDLANPRLNVHNRLASFALGDTIGLLDERLLVTLGLRRQTIESRSYAYGTGALSSTYKKSRTSPVAGVVFKLRPNVSVYGNYIESLAQGATASGNLNGEPVQNLGEQLAPYVSKQKEIGLKYDTGRLGLGAALFTTSKPRDLIDERGYFTTSGKDRHRGLELSAYGELTSSLKLLAGLTLLDAKQKSTGSASTDGKHVIGVPRRQANLGAEWDVPGVSGLSLDGRIITTGSSYANAINTLRAPGWTRVDLGARYLLPLGDNLLTLRARVDNAADRNYWASVGGYPNNGYLVAGTPRSLSISATLEFY